MRPFFLPGRRGISRRLTGVEKWGRIMGLKVVHIDRAQVSKDAAAKAFYENVLKPKWEAQARERALKLRAELMGVKPDTLRSSPAKNRG